MTTTTEPAMTEADMWRAVADSDARQDGRFVYAVRTTAIFCRPSCRSRRPRRENVRFFESAAAAREAGFRPCRRCRPEAAAAETAEAALVARACALIDAADDGPPTLDDLAARLDVPPRRLRRAFVAAIGVTPRGYAEARRSGRFRARLRDGSGVADAIYAAGYGSPSRVYEDAAGRLGMTPATYRRGGAGATIGYAIVPSALGRLLVAATGHGICMIAIGDDDANLVDELRAEFPAARIVAGDGPRRDWVRAVVDHLSGATQALDLPLDVCATAFQWRVWQALRAIPYGEVRTYREIAEALDAPRASRAVGRACATNPVAVAVPCHRAVGSDGKLHGYRWGLERKRALLAREAAAG